MHLFIYVALLLFFFITTYCISVCSCVLICTMCMCSQMPLSVTASQVVALDVQKVKGNREKPFVYCI